MKVSAILKNKGSDVSTINADIPVAEAARILHDKKIGAVIVSDAGKVVAGILSERDIVRGAAEKGGAVLTQPVSSLMTSTVMCCGPEDTVDSVMNMMTDRRIRHVPVLDDGNLCGIISIGDVVKTKIAETEAEAEALKAYIATG